MKPAVALSLLFLLIVFQAVFVASYIQHEHTIYFWDHAMYIGLVRNAYDVLIRDFSSGWGIFKKSLADNYNLIFALPSFISFTLFDSSRLVFVLTNFFVFFLAYEAAFAFFLKRALQLEWPLALFLSSAIALFIPPLWLPLLEGYPDIGALAALVFAAAIAISGTEHHSIRRGLLFGFALGFAILLRRHFAYASIALFIVSAGFALADIARTQNERGIVLKKAILYFAAVVCAFGGVLGLVAPDFLWSALTTNYGALYVSYHRPILTFLHFMLGGFGLGLLAIGITGLFLLARLNAEGSRLAFFTAFFAGTALVIWCLGPDQMGHHYMLHAVPLLISVGLAGWYLFLTTTPNSAKYIAGGLVLTCLAANSAWALWLSPSGVWPNDNGRPGLASAPRPPVVRPDIAEWHRLADYIARTTGPNDRIMVVGSSFVFNQDIFHSLYAKKRAFDVTMRFPKAPEIDHEEPAPFDAFAGSNIYIVATPPQYHLDPSGQRVITAAANQFPPKPDRASLFHKDDVLFHLADGVTVDVWRRENWTPGLLHEVLAEIRNDGPQDKIFAQDWAASSLPLRTQVLTDANNLTFAAGLFDPDHKDMQLFFDHPLMSGNYMLKFAVAGNCPDPKFRLSVRTSGGQSETAEEFGLPEQNQPEMAKLFSVPDIKDQDCFLLLDLDVNPAAMCRMEMSNLRVEKY